MKDEDKDTLVVVAAGVVILGLAVLGRRATVARLRRIEHVQVDAERMQGKAAIQMGSMSKGLGTIASAMSQLADIAEDEVGLRRAIAGRRR